MARDAIAFTPGDIVELMDNHRAASRLGGRIISHAGRVIIVDADVSELVSSGDSMSLMGRDGKLVEYSVSTASGNVITLAVEPSWVRNGTVFVISTANQKTTLWRVMSIAETENNSVYSITAWLHDPRKQAIVDEGIVFDKPNDSVNGYRVPNIENLRIINTNNETVQVSASWETATTTRKISFDLTVYTEDGRVVAQYETEQYRYDFYGLETGSYSLGVRGRNDNGMKGAETQVSMVIGAPPAPSSVIWTPGLFSADLVPVMRITATSDTSFEFWYAGLTQIINHSDVEDQAQFLGRSTQWTLHGLQADKTYYVYVRTRNAFGVSGFVESSGKASSDIPGMIEIIDEGIRDSEVFKNLLKGVDVNLEGIMQNALTNHGTVEHQYQQYGEVRAEILTVRTTVATLNGAFAELADYVQAQIGPEGELMAAVNQKMIAEVKSDGTAKASFTLNMGIIRNNIKYNTGFGMSLEPNGSGGYISTALFAADQFGIYSGSEPGNYQKAFFVFNGQVFMNSAFIQDASINRCKITDVLNSDNYIQGKTGVSINFKTGMAEFNDVTIRGTVYATDGDFKGTVRAEKIIGDVTTAGIIPFSSNTAKGRVKVESHAVYKGGMPYDMYLSIPNIQVRMDGYDESGSTPSSVNLAANVKIIIGGNTVLNNTINATHARLSFFSGGVLIKSNSESINIDVSVEIPVVGGSYPVTLTLFDSPIFALKANSSQFI